MRDLATIPAAPGAKGVIAVFFEFLAVIAGIRPVIARVLDDDIEHDIRYRGLCGFRRKVRAQVFGCAKTQDRRRENPECHNRGRRPRIPAGFLKGGEIQMVVQPSPLM